jgi:hypothetical protein
MRGNRQEFKEACQRIRTFRKDYGLHWKQFSNLAVLDRDFENLNPFRWPRIVESGEVTAGPVWARTMKLAHLIKQSPEKVLLAAGETYISSDLKKQREFRLLKEVTEYQHLLLFVDAPEAVGPACVQYAGRGQHKAAFLFLCQAFDREASKRLETAMPMLEWLVYLGYRCMTPQGFADGIARYVLPHLQDRGDKRKRRCSPIARLRALAQLWCMANERHHAEKAHGIWEVSGIREIFRSEGNGVRALTQLVRNQSVFESLRLGDGKAGYVSAKKALELNPNDYGNQRAVAMVKSTAYRCMDKPNFAAAYDCVQPYYKTGREDLLAAMRKRKALPLEMFHVFTCTYLGANLQSLAKTKYPKAQQEEDLLAIQWCMGQYEHEIQMDDPSRLKEREKLSPELAAIRQRCTRRGFFGNSERVLHHLIEAVTALSA